MSELIAANDAEDAMLEAKAKLASKFKHHASPKARKTREKKIRATVDGRSLAATGRLEQFNIRVRADVRQMVVSTAAERGCTIAELVELIFIEALGVPS